MLPQTGCGPYNGPKVCNSGDSCGRHGDEVKFFQDLYLKVQGDVNKASWILQCQALQSERKASLECFSLGVQN